MVVQIDFGAHRLTPTDLLLTRLTRLLNPLACEFDDGFRAPSVIFDERHWQQQHRQPFNCGATVEDDCMGS